MSLHKHQLEGAAILATRRRFGLLDDPGVGKTAQAVLAIDKLNARRVLIVGPPSALATNWPNQCKQWSEYGELHRCTRFMIAGDMLTYKARVDRQARNGAPRGAEILLMTYAMARRNYALIKDYFDVLILDEAHLVKNPNALQTQRILGSELRGESGIAQWAQYTWFLTGTLMTNSVIDAYPLLYFTGAYRGTQDAFLGYFCTVNPVTGKAMLRPNRADELKQLIRSVSIRRTSEEVQKHLPPLTTTIEYIDSHDKKALADIRLAYLALPESIQKALNSGDLATLNDMSEHLATLRRLIALAKAHALAQHYVDQVKEDVSFPPTLIYGHHKEALRTIKDALDKERIRSVMVTGSTRRADRSSADATFQQDESVRYFIGNLEAAGTALTLTRAPYVDIFDPSWVPAINFQAFKRAHREGQKQAVLGRFIVLRNTVDEIVMHAVKRKADTFKTLGFDTGLDLDLTG